MGLEWGGGLYKLRWWKFFVFSAWVSSTGGWIGFEGEEIGILCLDSSERRRDWELDKAYDKLGEDLCYSSFY